jgi:hypothetical protein
MEDLEAKLDEERDALAAERGDADSYRGSGSDDSTLETERTYTSGDDSLSASLFSSESEVGDSEDLGSGDSEYSDFIPRHPKLPR